MSLSKPARSLYSESEAANALGISIDELRLLIRQHVVQSDDEISPGALDAFAASDILLLRILSSARRKAS